MAETNIPQQITSKPNEKVFISSPYTARVVEQAKRLDRIVRRADERYGRGQMTESRYEEIRARCRTMVARLEKDISDLDDGGRKRTRSNAKPTGTPRGNGAQPKASSTTARPAKSTAASSPRPNVNDAKSTGDATASPAPSKTDKAAEPTAADAVEKKDESATNSSPKAAASPGF